VRRRAARRALTLCPTIDPAARALPADGGTQRAINALVDHRGLFY